MTLALIHIRLQIPTKKKQALSHFRVTQSLIKIGMQNVWCSNTIFFFEDRIKQQKNIIFKLFSYMHTRLTPMISIEKTNRDFPM